MSNRREFFKKSFTEGTAALVAPRLLFSATSLGAEKKVACKQAGMQYFRPANPECFVGDPMPFWHEGRFHLFYLLDCCNHKPIIKGGLDWGHASTTDLVHWEHHPVAIACGPPGTIDAHRIATGSLIEHGGVIYGFYSTHVVHEDGHITQHVCVATSSDCLHFTKSPGNPILSAPDGFNPRHFRDPHVFRDQDGRFHMLVATERAGNLPANRRTCIAHYTSVDLKSWKRQEAPFLVPGYPYVPECPDYFYWNGYYYLTFLYGSQMHYRVSRQPFGPWTKPKVDTIDGRVAAAFKTGRFGAGRRLAVAFLRWREKDDGPWPYAGNAVFRELIQEKDGTLRSKFPEEMIPTTGSPLPLSLEVLKGEAELVEGNVHLSATETSSIVRLRARCAHGRITCRIEPVGQVTAFGLCVRVPGAYKHGYEIRFMPQKKMVWIRSLRYPPKKGEWHETVLYDFEGLDRPFTLDLVMKDDIIDICVDRRRCLIGRYPQWSGQEVCFFCESGEVRFKEVTVCPLV